jgi:hypothetical protein
MKIEDMDIVPDPDQPRQQSVGRAAATGWATACATPSIPELR